MSLAFKLKAVARANKRTIALPYNYFAYLALLRESGLKINDFSEIVLYEKKKGNLKSWEKNLLKKYPYVTSSEIRKHQRDYLVILNFYQIQELIDFQPDKNSYFYGLSLNLIQRNQKYRRKDLLIGLNILECKV